VADALVPLITAPGATSGAAPGAPPYALFGASMGALIAFLVARALRRRGAPPPHHLFLAAFPAPQLPNPLANFGLAALVALDAPPDRLADELRRFGFLPEALLGSEALKLAVPALRADLALVLHHSYRAEPPLAVPITVLGGQADLHIGESVLAPWAVHTAAAFRLELLPGPHLFYQSEAVLVLAAIARALGG
jgi:surfactin synthase thioesterase subunit